MKVCGIVCEYNPFHNGHIHHLQKTKEITQCDLVIGVMSGNFVQRGEPAIIDKWKRAEITCRYGVDLIIELPFIYATQSAEVFARASMYLLKLIGCDCFCFGSESNQLDTLKELSQMQFEHHDKSISLVKSYEQTLGNLQSNDILAINYLKYCQDMTPYCIQRTNSYLCKEINGTITSATSIRQALLRNEDISNTTPMDIQGGVYLQDYYPMIQFLLWTLPKEYLKNILMMDEGIENLLIKNTKYDAFEEFMNHCITKKYTRSRIQRTLIHLLNQTMKKEVQELALPQYVRVLAFNDKGRKYLANCPCKVASRFNQMDEKYRQMEYKATLVYASAFDERKRKQIVEDELRGVILI
ncbi:MAG: nucleotidyltransferase family protein [Traorella sp.]